VSRKIAFSLIFLGQGGVWAGRTIVSAAIRGTYIFVRLHIYYTNNYTHTHTHTHTRSGGSFHFLFACPLTFAEGAEEGAPVKKARAPAQPGGEELLTKNRPVAQEEEEDPDDAHQAQVPAGFLSPSVLQALELGKAIPGA